MSFIRIEKSARTARISRNAKRFTDATAARPVEPDLLPRERTQGDVRYLSGGGALREVIAIRHAMHQYSLTLEFRFAQNGKKRFATGIPVIIRDRGGHAVLKVASAGPFLLVKLRPGSYEIVAEAQGRKQKRETRVSANGGQRLVFEWATA